MLRFTLVLAALLVSPPVVSARTWHINPDGTGDAATIQAAVDSATAGDVVDLACGTYFEHNISIPIELTLSGQGSDPSCVVIDAQQQDLVFGVTASAANVAFERITVTGGYRVRGEGAGIQVLGGSSVRLTRCRILGNSVGDGWGGGILVNQGPGPVTIVDCVFANNTAGYGGGIYNHGSQLSIQRTAFHDNQSRTVGGAVRTSGTALIQDCEFARNDGGMYSVGGAISLTSYSTSIVLRCTFSNNTADLGGAIALYAHASTRLVACRFEDNSASQGGGALYLSSLLPSTVANCAFFRNAAPRGGAALSASPVSFDECLFASNSSDQGGALWLSSSEHTILRSTFFANAAEEGSGIWNDGVFVTLENTTVVGGIGGQAVSCYPGEYMFLRCCNIFGNEGGDIVACLNPGGSESNFSADPLFCDPDAGDYHLQWGSPCLPANSPDGCGLIGALGFGGCNSVSVTPESWARVKARYR